jgi:hypothetical protein
LLPDGNNQKNPILACLRFPCSAYAPAQQRLANRLCIQRARAEESVEARNKPIARKIRCVYEYLQKRA